MAFAKDLLIRLGLARRSKWEPRTLADNILTSPLTYLTTLLYHLVLFLRGRPAGPPPGKQPLRVVCISDTHENLVSVPDGDLLIHAGDLTSSGSAAAIQAQIDWLDGLPHRWKIVVGGNHDSWFDPAARLKEDRETGRRVDRKSLIYLHHDAVGLDLPDGRRLTVYGASDIPGCGGAENAFQYQADSPPWANTIPRHTDILVTHTPPYGHMDLGLGCPGLLKEIWNVKPRLHVFGHVHWGHGRQAVYWDECQRAYESLMSRPPRGPFRDLIPHAGWLDAARVAYYGIGGILWRWLMIGSSGNFGSEMVNAAQMWGNTGKVKSRAVVVVL